MPQSTVKDPITSQEMAFAHLILSGTMNDRGAAKAAGLNPDTAASTRSKPGVRAYMIEHRAADSEKPVDQQADGLRALNLGRDQILARLWTLANLSPEDTRGNIAGQMKAMAMIVAIEGLIPDRRASPSGTQTPVPPLNPKIGNAASCHEPGTADPKPATKPASNQSSPNLDYLHRNSSGMINPFTHPERLDSVAVMSGLVFDAMPATNTSLKLPFFPKKGFPARQR